MRGEKKPPAEEVSTSEYVAGIGFFVSVGIPLGVAIWLVWEGEYLKALMLPPLLFVALMLVYCLVYLLFSKKGEDGRPASLHEIHGVKRDDDG